MQNKIDSTNPLSIAELAKLAGGSVRSAGTTYTNLTPVALPFEGELLPAGADRSLVAGSGEYSTPIDGAFTLGDPIQIRKLVETNVANETSDEIAFLNRAINYREVTTSGLSQLRDGTYVDDMGTVYAHPSGFTSVDPELVDGAGDGAAKTKHEAPQSYYYKVGKDDVEKTLPDRN